MMYEKLYLSLEASQVCGSQQETWSDLISVFWVTISCYCSLICWYVWFWLHSIGHSAYCLSVVSLKPQTKEKKSLLYFIAPVAVTGIVPRDNKGHYRTCQPEFEPFLLSLGSAVSYVISQSWMTGFLILHVSEY